MVGNELNKPKALENTKKDNAIEDINKINSLKSEEKDNEVLARYIRDESPPVERVKFEGLDDRDSICSEESDNDKLPPIPDGGWGWVVVFAAFLTSACADGLAYSFGLLHEEFTNYFEASQSKTSLIGSLFIAIPLISGPIMSALVDRYGCRVMTMLAGFLSTVGFLLASISNSVEMLCLTLGVISGLAMGILYVTSVVAVAFWFDKRRTLAVSLASCGIGFGTLVYSPMTNYFLEQFDWRNTIVLLAGTVLNVCVCGALMRDPDWVIIKEKREKEMAKARSRKSSSAGSLSSRSVGGESMYLTSDELNDLLKSGKTPEYILSMLTTSLAQAEQLEATTQMNAEQSYKRINSDIHLPTFIQQKEQVPAEVIEKLSSNKLLYNVILHNYPHLITRRRSEVNLYIEGHPPPNSLNEHAQLPVTVKAKRPDAQDKKDTKEKAPDKLAIQSDGKETQDKKDDKPKHDKPPTIATKDQPNPPQTSWLKEIFTDHHYLRDMTLYKNTIVHRGAMMNIPRYKLRASSLPDIYRNSTWSIWSGSDDKRRWYDRVLDALKSTFEPRMFTEFHFLIFNLASLILSVWAIIPFFFLKSYMTEMEVDGGAMMISIIGIASGVGIVILGWAGDQPWINVTKTYAVCLFICGFSVAAFPFFITQYWYLAVVSTVFGLSFASSYSYTPAILIELMPIDYFTMGFGVILLSQGIGHLIGPPLGGLIYDLTGTWDLTFYVGGIWLAIAGVCVGVIPYTKNRRLYGKSPLIKDEETSTRNGSIV